MSHSTQLIAGAGGAAEAARAVGQEDADLRCGAGGRTDRAQDPAGRAPSERVAEDLPDALSAWTLAAADHGHRRRREEKVWDGWMVSAVLHAALLLVLSVALLPKALSQSDTLVADVAFGEEEKPLATFIADPDDGIDDTADLGLLADTLLDSLKEGIEQDAGAAARRRSGAKEQEDGSLAPRDGSGGQSGPQAEYFGTTAYGDRFVYVLDVSSSMEGRSGRKGSDTRFDRAAYELVRSIEKLTADQSFYVLLFSSDTRRMFDDDKVPHMLPATPENKEKLRKWITTVHPGGNTDPREALYLGLALRPSAVFILSDGEFNGQRDGHRSSFFDGNLSAFEVVAGNNPGKAPIHSFAYEDPVNRKAMERLASETGGDFRYIPPLGDEPPPPPPRVQMTDEQRAAGLLRLAATLERAGRTRVALLRYREIAAKYPATSAGKEAQARALKLDPSDRAAQKAPPPAGEWD